ncbi:MAG TPA: BtpA/SgcQ family protein [Bdellovibrionota bacterium]|nr:BtpA/SgcQ family protein [Bdellovibrionota bacterium]
MAPNKAGQLPSLVGVIHLPPLPGSPRAWGRAPSDALDRAGSWALEEARLLERAGFDGIILENFGDAPFYKDRVPSETVAALSVICAAVRENCRVALGLNVLRNDGAAALAVASVTGLDFIRINVLTGAAATDQGIIEGRAAEILRERQRLQSRVKIMADVLVKHARPLNGDDVAQAVDDTALRGLADAVIITGAGTGRPVEENRLGVAGRGAKKAGVPLYVGSGATPETLPGLLKHARGILVGSALRRGGLAGQPLDGARVRRFTAAYKDAKRRRK